MEDGKVIVKKRVIVEEREDDGKVEKTENTQNSEEMTILVSGALHKDGKTFVRVSFLRGKDWAEGIVPDGVIEKSEGFTEDEIKKLVEYLAAEKDLIIQQAKGVNPIRSLLGM